MTSSDENSSEEGLQRIADELAHALHRELSGRQISVTLSPERGVKSSKICPLLPDYIGDLGDKYQAILIIKRPDIIDLMSWEAVVKQYVNKWARELGIKLSRLFPMTIYKLELPGGVESALGIFENVAVRVISSYAITIDEPVYRIDVLASWDES